jgi:hypothetical protein
MTRYSITPTDQGVDIELTDTGEKQELLLAAFDDCAQGRCSCPTDQYRNVEEMEVDPGEDSITIRLQAKNGTEFDARQIASCLDYTVDRAGR